MTRLCLRTVAIVMWAGLLNGAASQTSTSIVFDYATVAYPGATFTQVTGINNSNVVVGFFLDSAGRSHGFVYRQGKFAAVNFPHASATEVLGINDLGDIVGVFGVPGPLNFHGFERHNGVFRAIDDPKAAFGTMAFGISKSGTIVGSYDNAHGFVFANGAFRTLDAPQLPGEVHDTQLNGINNLGWISGQVFTKGIWRGFWIVSSDLDFLQPAGTMDSQVTGSNRFGDLVGCHDAQAGFISFAVENGEGTERSEKSPTQAHLVSCASAINDARVVVGNYFTIKQPNGFLAVPALTLKVTSPVNHSSNSNPVPLSATAFGTHAIAEMEVWVNSKKVFQASGNSLDRDIVLPVGENERFAIHAVDVKGVTTKVVETISVH